jgi:hypothetical protein
VRRVDNLGPLQTIEYHYFTVTTLDDVELVSRLWLSVWSGHLRTLHYVDTMWILNVITFNK